MIGRPFRCSLIQNVGQISPVPPLFCALEPSTFLRSHGKRSSRPKKSASQLQWLSSLVRCGRVCKNRYPYRHLLIGQSRSSSIKAPPARASKRTTKIFVPQPLEELLTLVKHTGRDLLPLIDITPRGRKMHSTGVAADSEHLCVRIENIFMDAEELG